MQANQVNNLTVKIQINGGNNKTYCIKSENVMIQQFGRCSVEHLDHRLHEFLRLLPQIPEDFLFNGFTIMGLESRGKIILSDKYFNLHTISQGNMVYKINGYDHIETNANNLSVIGLKQNRDCLQMAADTITQ